MTKFIPLALAYIMFTLGLGLRISDFFAIGSHKKAFFTGLISQLVIVPLVFFLFVILLEPSPSVAFGLLLVGFCPGGVTSNLFSKMANGNLALSIALTGIVSLLSVVTLPILTATSYQHFFHTQMPSVSIAGLGIKLFVLTTIPVVIGMGLRALLPHFIENNQQLFSRSATVAFVIILVITIVSNQAQLGSMVSSIGFALPIISAVLLLVSWLISWALSLSVSDKRTIAIETSVQNGSVGIAVAFLIYSGQGMPEYALPPLLYGLLMNAIVIPFVWLQSRRQVFAVAGRA